MLFEKQISKDADKLICILYKEYLVRREHGLPKNESSIFGDSDEIQQSFLSNKNSSDVADTCWELHNAGYLFCHASDDIANEVTLTNDGIVYMENRFKSNLSEVLKFISLFK
jgi:hypothetical protein